MFKLHKKIKINNKLIKTIIALTSGRFLNLLVSFILLLVQSYFIGPDITGKVAYFAIPLGYLWILTLGVPSALARELPYYLGKDDQTKSELYVRTAETFSIIIGISCSTIFLIISLKSLLVGDYFSAIGWGVQVISAFFTIYNTFIITLFRTTDEFVYIAKSNTVAAIARVVIFPLIFINPYFGLYLKSLFIDILTNTYLFFKRPIKIKLGFDIKIFKELILFGLPLIAVGYIEANLWTSIQSTIIARFGTTTQLGLFNFSNQILLVLLIIPNVITEIFRPKLASIYGKSNENLIVTLKSILKPILITFIMSLFVFVLSWLLMDKVILILLSKYKDSINAIKLATLLLPIMTLSSVKYIFVVTKNIKYNLFSTLPGFILGISILFFFQTKKISFDFIFLPYIFGQTTNLLVTSFLIFKLVKKELIINLESI